MTQPQRRTNAPRYNNLDITPTQVALSLLELSRALAEATSDLDDIEQAVVNAEEAFVMKEAELTIKAKMREELTSDTLRKAWVTPQIEEERFALATAKAIVRARKLKIDTLKTRVTIGQTVCNALQSELDLERLRSR
jgi:ABC-type cobalamin/Fe3+-siderophores transport system ATPase subunit